MRNLTIFKTDRGYAIRNPGWSYLNLSPRFDGNFRYACGYLDSCSEGQTPEEKWGWREATWLELLVMLGITRSHIEHILNNKMDTINVGIYLDGVTGRAEMMELTDMQH